MTDQNIPDVTDNGRRVAYEWASCIDPNITGWSDRELAAARVILDTVPTPQRRTLADMTSEERDGCRWMQADTEAWGRVVITVPDRTGVHAALLKRGGSVVYEDHGMVTPRPDLPRMEWPGSQKPSFALPDGWRLADHPEHGRVIVTKPAREGHVYFVNSNDALPMGCDWHFCDPSELTYLDTDTTQEKNND